MAWTNTVKTLSMTPYLIKEIDVTPDSTTATAITHGETRAPDLYFGVNVLDGPTAEEFSIVSVAATTITVDVEASTARPRLWLLWISQGSAGLNP